MTARLSAANCVTSIGDGLLTEFQTLSLSISLYLSLLREELRNCVTASLRETPDSVTQFVLTAVKPAICGPFRAVGDAVTQFVQRVDLPAALAAGCSA